VQQEAYIDLWVTRKEKSREKGLPVSAVTMFALITKLKQLCNYDPTSGESIKWDAFSVMLEDLSHPEDKIIVFSQYVETLEFISRRMAFFPHSLYSGELSQEEKDNALAIFKEKDGPRALLISLRAVDVGLNIQEASTIILFDSLVEPCHEGTTHPSGTQVWERTPLLVVQFINIDAIEKRIYTIYAKAGGNRNQEITTCWR